MLIRTLTCVALVAAAFASAFAAPASAKSGSHGDPRGDAPAHGDLVRGSAKYKGSTLKARVSLADFGRAESRRVAVGALFSKRRGGRCNTKSGAAISLETKSKIARAGLTDSAEAPMPARVRVRGNTAALSARDARFARKGFNCVVVSSLIAVGANKVKVLDQVKFRLGG